MGIRREAKLEAALLVCMEALYAQDGDPFDAWAVGWEAIHGKPHPGVARKQRLVDAPSIRVLDLMNGPDRKFDPEA